VAGDAAASPAGPSTARLPLGLGVLLGLWAAPLAAQDPITSDRPGIGSGSPVLGRGVVQVEAGFEYAGVDESDQLESRTLSVGQVLVRIGFDAFELELFGNSWARRVERVADETERGLEDFGFGVKLPAARGVGDRLDLSLQAVATAPTGSDAFTADGWGVDLNALADVALSERAGVSVNVGWHPSIDDPSYFAVIVTPGISLGGGYGAYAGWAGTLSSDLEDQHILEGGLTYLPGPDLQLDVNGGFDLERDAWFLGAGLATRWGAR